MSILKQKMTKNGGKFNKYVISLIVVIVLIISSFSTLAALVNNQVNDNIFISYSFERPSVSKVNYDETLYDQVNIDGAPCGGKTGDPSLPSKGVYILLPYGTTVKNINVVPGDKVLFGSDYKIKPNSEPIPISQISSSSHNSHNESMYRSDKTYPENLFDTIGVYGFRGYQILVLRLWPMQYIPNEGKLFYYKEMNVFVETEENNNCNQLFRGVLQDQIEVMVKVDNPEVVDTYSGKNNQLMYGAEYDLLILTNDDLKDHFERLMQFHNDEGISTIIKTLNDIGSNNPEDIRGYIRDAYSIWGIDYVLIGGDSDIVPACNLFAYAGWQSTFMPSDLYYACLDGPFNFDGDNKWGESNDGEGGGDVDMIAEVNVGRACVGDIDEVNFFVDKTIAYSNSSDDYLDKVLMVGEHLWSGPETWGGDYMDELIDSSSANGYNTTGIPSDGYTIDTLYDKDGTWQKSEIIDKINDGVDIINHLGHGNNFHVMKLDEPVRMMQGQIYEECHDIVDNLANDCYFFIYSQACHSGAFDNKSPDLENYPYDCIAEYLTTKTDHGAFAAIMNVRYGWGRRGSTDGPSQHFHREFWDAVFGENISVISTANQDSKEDNLYRINDECMRWCYYQLHLFGDPTLSFRGSIDIGAIESEFIGLGKGSTVSFEIKNIGEIKVSDVKWSISVTGGIFGLIYVMDEGSIEEFNVADVKQVSTTEPISGFGRAVITVTADASNTNNAEKTINVFVLGPLIIIR